jgi:hypothetical protein
MNLPVCSHCGQPVLPPELPLPLPRLKRRLFDAVRRRPGIDAETLRGLVWADDPNGGPESFSALHVHVNQLNATLRPLGLRIRGRPGGYRIVEA